MLTGDSDVLDVPGEVENYVLWKAKARAAAHLDPSKIGYAETQANRAWMMLVRDEQMSQVKDWDINA